MCGDVVERQLCFNEDGSLPKRLKPLSQNQKEILFWLDRGYTQTQIADKITSSVTKEKLSRPRINQIVKHLECELGLINRVQNNKKRDGVRDYSYFYSLTDKAKAILKGNLALEELTPWRVHNHRMKFHIYQQSGSPRTDTRCGFQHSWFMRGKSERFKFWWHSDINLPSVSIDVHPKTIVFYTDKGQLLLARTKEQAAELGWQAIRKAMEWFVSQQRSFGVSFTLDIAGEQVGKLHLGVLAHDDGPLESIRKAQEKISEERVFGVEHPEWADRSTVKETGPGTFELEMFEDDPILTPVETAFKMVADLPAGLAEFNKALGPIQANTTQVLAMLQGGINMSQQYEQMLGFMTKVLNEMAAIREENRVLKEKMGIS